MPLFSSVRKSLLFASGAVLLSACATSQPDKGPTPLTFEIDRIEGIWQLPDEKTYVEIERCDTEKEDSALCGYLIHFEGNMEGRDWFNGELFATGRKLCGAPIITDVHFVDAQETYKGFFYDPSEGSQYHLNLDAVGGKKIVAHIYMGASADEFVDMAISLALGDVPGVFAGASLLTRAGIGEEHLGETKPWHRVAQAPQDCRAISS